MLQHVTQCCDAAAVVRDGLDPASRDSDHAEPDPGDRVGQRVAVGVDRIEGHHGDVIATLGPAAGQVRHVSLGAALGQRVDHESQSAGHGRACSWVTGDHVPKPPGCRRELFFGVQGGVRGCEGVRGREDWLRVFATSTYDANRVLEGVDCLCHPRPKRPVRRTRHPPRRRGVRDGGSGWCCWWSCWCWS